MNFVYTFVEVKIVSCILAIVVITLSVYPCSDLPGHGNDRTSNMYMAQVDSSDMDAGTLDLCTPFCTCSCCAAHVQVPIMFTYTLRKVTSSPAFNSYSSVFIERLCYTIWQPPKLV